MGEYLPVTTGLFVSGCYFSLIFSNKLPNFVLFHKCSFSLIVLKYSVKVVIGGGRVVRWCWVNFQCRGVLQFGLQ